MMCNISLKPEWTICAMLHKRGIMLFLVRFNHSNINIINSTNLLDLGDRWFRITRNYKLKLLLNY